MVTFILDGHMCIIPHKVLRRIFGTREGRYKRMTEGNCIMRSFIELCMYLFSPENCPCLAQFNLTLIAQYYFPDGEIKMVTLTGHKRNM
jgi:hypothetical protein